MSATGIPSSARESVYRVRVAYADTDQGGVVHHGTYLRYFECARVELMRERGVDYRRLEQESKLGLVVVEANVRYKLGAHFDDDLEIRTHVAQANRAKIRFDSVIMRGSSVLTRAELTLACVRFPEAKLCSMPREVLDLV